MKIINQSHEITRIHIEDDINQICEAYCVCYGTEVPETLPEKMHFIEKHIEHESPLEHSSMTVLFTTNRGISHEIVRHRHTAYTQQSTRYCNYSNNRFGNELTFIKNSRFKEGTRAWTDWLIDLQSCEDRYMSLMKDGYSAEEARHCLNNDLATKLYVTTNFREWRSIFKLRCDSHAHYQMQQLMIPLLDELLETELRCVFGDLADLVTRAED